MSLFFTKIAAHLKLNLMLNTWFRIDMRNISIN